MCIKLLPVTGIPVLGETMQTEQNAHLCGAFSSSTKSLLCTDTDTIHSSTDYHIYFVK